MKDAIIGVVLGILVTSVAWFGYVWHIQAKHAAEYCGFFAGEAAFAEKLMAQAQSPSEETRLETQRAAARMILGWIRQVDETDQRYPFMNLKEHCSSQYSQAVALVDKWKKESSSETELTSQ